MRCRGPTYSAPAPLTVPFCTVSFYTFWRLFSVSRAQGIRALTKPRKPSFDLERYLASVGVGRTIHKYKRNQIVFRQGAACDAVFYIREGKCKLSVLSRRGKEAVVGILSNGDFIGEGCLTGQPKRLATAITLTQCEILKLDKATVIDVLHKQPKFADLFMSHLLARNARVEGDLVDQLFNSSEKRLARLLLLMANFGKDGGPHPIATKISQETLAEMIGTTRSRVNVFMNKFRKLGFIEYNGDLRVHSSLLSLILHDEPQLGKSEEADFS